MSNQSGQIGIVTTIGWGITVAALTIGGWLGQNYRTDTKIDTVKTEMSAFKFTTGREISTLNAESVQYRKDIDSINRKLDEIIKILK